MSYFGIRPVDRVHHEKIGEKPVSQTKHLSRNVPYDPTAEMLTAARDIDPALPIEHIRRLWLLMWKAAPQPERKVSRNLLDEFLEAAKKDGVTHLRIPVAPEPAAPQPVAVPQGFAVVPVEPTPEMMAAFKRAYKEGSFWTERMHRAVAEMLAAAPQAPSREPMSDQSTVDLVKKCRAALAEELSAYDIEPPLHHVKEAHDDCDKWLRAHGITKEGGKQ